MYIVIACLLASRLTSSWSRIGNTFGWLTSRHVLINNDNTEKDAKRRFPLTVTQVHVSDFLYRPV